MKVLVTGGAGYVGCVLVRQLLEAGHDVRVLDSLRSGGAGLFPLAGHSRFEFLQGDVRDEAIVGRALEGVEIICHLAAIVGYPACAKEPLLARQVNLDATVQLDRLRNRDQLILFGSSLSNYGSAFGGTCTEETEPVPISLYGETKIAAEKALLSSGNVVLFRPATAFGVSPRMRLDLLFNDFVHRAVRDHQLVVFEQQYLRAFIHVSDFAAAFLHAIQYREQMRDQLFNLGDESLNLSKGDLARRVRNQVDFVLSFDETGKDPDQRNYQVDFSKLRRSGFRVRVSIDDGIRELVRAYALLDARNPYSNAHV